MDRTAHISSINKQITILVALVTLSFIVPARAELTARDIIQRMDDNQRHSTDSAFTRMRLTTCQYGIKKGQLKCVEKPRIKLVESVQIHAGIAGKDSRSIAFVLEPTSERDIGMLSYTYDDINQDNQTWLYLSALDKVKRIASSSNNEHREPASLFGSEITTEDQQTGKLDDYDYRLLQRSDYRNRPVFIIESKPKPHRLNKNRYAKIHTWVDAERFIALKIQMYNHYDQAIKRLQASHVELINDIWLARSMTFMNLVSQRLTHLQIEAITFKMAIDPDFITQRSLTDPVFREHHLNQLRLQAQ